VRIPALALAAAVLVFGGAAAGLALSNHRLVGGLFLVLVVLNAVASTSENRVQLPSPLRSALTRLL